MKKGSRPVLVILALVIAAGAAAGFWGFRNYQFQRSLARYFTGRYEQVPYARGLQALEEALEQYREDGLPGSYAQPDGRKEVSHSWNPIELVRSPSWITLVALLVLALAVALVALVVRGIVRVRRRRRYGGGYRRRRWL